MNIAELTEKMHEYFKTTIDQARGEYKDKDGRPGWKSRRQIASPAGLCIALGISKDKLFAMRGGTEEEQQFFSDTMLWYEEAGAAMLSGNMIDNQTYRGIKETCKEKSVEADNTIQLIFSAWNAPDDWEQYKELRAICEKHQISWDYASQLIEDAMKGLTDDAASNH